jgi:uncharacterized protein YbcI
VAVEQSTGQLASEISNAVIQRIRDTTGRGPNRARTTVGRDAVFVVVEDTLTKGEQVLVDAGDVDTVIRMRSAWQEVMSGPVRADVERLTGRRVIAFMSANHIEPDLACETFILAPSEVDRAVAEGDAAD